MWIFKTLLHFNYYVFIIACFLLWCLHCFSGVLKFGKVTTQHKSLHNHISCENLNLVMLLSFLCETIKWIACNKTHSGNGSSVKTLEAWGCSLLQIPKVCNIAKIQETCGAQWLGIWVRWEFVHMKMKFFNECQ